MQTTRRGFIAASAAAVAASQLKAAESGELVVVVLDPLAAELSCPCVEGYAQRDYAKLGKFLSEKLAKPVKVAFGESLEGALAKKTAGKVDVIIGKDSVVREDARVKAIPIEHIACLTGKDGLTTQTGLIVVAGSDATLSADQLKGYRMLFGPKKTDEKHAAAMKLLTELGVALPRGEAETCPSCTDAATKVIDIAKKGEKICGLISNYAKPLLEGCGTVKKGDLKVVGETDPVPFIGAFAATSLPESMRAKIKAAFLEVAKDAELCRVMETKAGFVEPKDATKKK